MVNKVILIGNLGRDPEVRSTPSGQPNAKFTLATSRRWKDKNGQKQEQTEWHQIVVWGAQAETCAKYLTKGREVYVEGEIRTRNYEGKDGNKRYVTEIVAQQVRFLGGAGDRSGARDPGMPDAAESSGGYADTGGPVDDDVPF